MDLVAMTGEITGKHWGDLEELLPLYRAITASQVGNGVSTSFWADRWLSLGRLQDIFPVLYSHVTRPDISVAHVVSAGIRATLVPRLTREGREELNKLEEIIHQVTLSADDDKRSSALMAKDNVLRAGPIYKALMNMTGTQPAFVHFVWKNKAPPGFSSLHGS